MKSTMSLEKSIFIFDGHNGIHIPQFFAEEMLHPSCLYQLTSDSIVAKQMLNELAKEKHNGFYWDNWNDILCYFNELRKIGTKELFYLTQDEDGDLWLVHEDELWEWNEYSGS